ncbi:DUF3152 domain-containing protein [Actinoplanes sp. CA-030573]|uniref:DUF3152 domain-containing protein n=1 Tax=Actinoplanes sp. CA-030573 TaxID=3239898 RepID=UPI003D8AC228
MIDEAAPRVAPPDHWRRWWLTLLALTIVVATGLLVGHTLSSDAAQVPAAAPSGSQSPSPPPSQEAPILENATLPPAVESPAVQSPAVQSPAVERPAVENPVPGPPPAKGTGAFLYAIKRGPVLGTNGTLKRFHVAVEQGSNEDINAFADAVQATLGDQRSWVGGGQLRLQLVPGADKADFTVYLATRVTAGDLCRRGGTNIRINGVPYTSCRTTGKAIINLDRWRLSSKPYVNAKVPLSVYRQYVINHEVGHELGHHHEGCPKQGGPAPVMVQQTLTTRGCVPYAWPRRDGRFLTGPAL